MLRVRLNLRKLSVLDKVARGRQIVKAMTNNPRFANSSPSLNEVTTVLDELENASALLQAAKADVATRTVTQENVEGKVDQVLTQLASYVESVAGKDDAVIASAAMETRASRSAPSIPTPPQALNATAGDHDGEIELSWKPIQYAKSYTIEYSTDPADATTWTHTGIATSATKVITNLKSGTRYWFRVAAIGAVGQSGWSEPATKIAP